MSYVNISAMPCVMDILKKAEDDIKIITGKDVRVAIDKFDINMATERKEVLQRIVSSYFKVSWEAIESSSRKTKQHVVDARHVYMYLARTQLKQTLKEIGRDCGGRDHTSVVHAMKKINGFYYSDDPLIKDVNKLITITNL